MAKSKKIHWSGEGGGSLGCATSRSKGLHAVRHHPSHARLFVQLREQSPDWYCSDCAKAARIALAAESAPKPASRCATSGCGSHAINPGQSGRDDTSDLDLCDVCYWRKRAESTDSDRYAELRKLVEDCQLEAMDPASPVVVFDNALRLVLDWRHR